MNFWAFADKHPDATVLMAMILGITLCALFKWSFLAFNRSIRHLNIKAHGWPPGHCDADGDGVESEEAEEVK